MTKAPHLAERLGLPADTNFLTPGEVAKLVGKRPGFVYRRLNYTRTLRGVRLGRSSWLVAEPDALKLVEVTGPAPTPHELAVAALAKRGLICG